MIKIGLVGIGFMGYIHYLAGQRLRGGKVVAVSSRDAQKLAGDWRGIRGNFGPPGQMMDLSAVKKYSELDDLLADPEIDLVDICNPTHLHSQTALRALKAGKHVLVEKAIALTAAEADEMLAVAREQKKLLMVAHVLPYFPEFAYAAQVIKSGDYGRMLGAHFTRVIAKPDWSDAIGDQAATGGPAVDLHIHDTHFISLIADVPQAVSSVGQVGPGGSVDYLTTSYLYGPGGPTITCSSGALAAATRPFVHGFEIYLERATLAYSSAGVPLTLYPAQGEPTTPQLEGGGDPITAFALELESAVTGVATNTMPKLLSGQLARDALVLCHKECQSVKEGRVVSMTE